MTKAAHFGILVVAALSLSTPNTFGQLLAEANDSLAVPAGEVVVGDLTLPDLCQLLTAH